KKHRFQPSVVKNYIKRIDILISSNRIEDLFPFHSLNYEVLSGDKKGISSIRIDNQYRLEFIVSLEGEPEPIITICTIKDITNHYK
nr:type II toxin-antitoxin system RelE/ParE family toxin [Bacteroidales bacterium]